MQNVKLIVVFLRPPPPPPPPPPRLTHFFNPKVRCRDGHRERKKKPEVQYLMGLKLDFEVLRGISNTFCDHNQIMFETKITYQQTYHFDLTQNLNECVKKSEYSETNLNLSTKTALLNRNHY